MPTYLSPHVIRNFLERLDDPNKVKVVAAVGTTVAVVLLREFLSRYPQPPPPPTKPMPAEPMDDVAEAATLDDIVHSVDMMAETNAATLSALQQQQTNIQKESKQHGQKLKLAAQKLMATATAGTTKATTDGNTKGSAGPSSPPSRAGGEHRQRNHKYKTELCHFHGRDHDDWCPHKADCHFARNDGELRPVPKPCQKGQVPIGPTPTGTAFTPGFSYFS